MDDTPMNPEETPAEEQRSYVALASILLAVVVIVLILLFWRSCDAATDSGQDSGGGGVIEKVAGLDVVTGGIAVWLKPDVAIQDVLARNGLSEAEAVAFGDGTFVIAIGDHDPARTVARLKTDSGLYDAGFLYAEE